MKIRSLLVFLFIFIAMILLPNDSLAANKTGTYDDKGTIYELFDDYSARVIEVAIGTTDANYGNVRSEITGGFQTTDGNEYKVTSIAGDALKNIVTEQDLYVHGTVAPVLETDNPKEFFKNIRYIYVPEENSYEPQNDATGYTEENGWIQDKLRNYIVTKQPKNEIEVTAGNITSDDTLEVAYELMIGGHSYTARWYYCDENGNILDKNGNRMSEEDIKTDGDDPNVEVNYIGDDLKFQIPTDLSYNNENKSSKVYYFRAVVGNVKNILEYSDVAKVTVKPGTYKISFYYDTLKTAEPVVLSVNDKRMLDDTEMAKIPTENDLAQYKEGKTFAGWTTEDIEDMYRDEINIVKTEDLETMVFEKNTTFYPVWKTKVNFDANGGKFADGSTVVSVYSTNYDGFLEQMPEPPTKQGYEFIEYFTKKIGGHEFWLYMEENDVMEEVTFYAQWEKTEVNESINQNKGEEKDDTSPTGNDSISYVIITAIACLGILTILKITKNKKANRKH